MNVPWSAKDAVQPGGVYDALHTGLTVRSIQTPADRFVYCEASDPVERGLTDDKRPFDYLPVLDDRGGGRRIIGVFPAVEVRSGSATGLVRDYVYMLDDRWIIGADASIRDFVISADRHPCRFVVSGAAITGLVSLSDLQRLPVRAALFALITGFEIAMADRIRHEIDRQVGWDWKSKLSKDRQEKLEDKLRAARSQDDVDDELLFTEFCDKATICRKSFELSREAVRWKATFGRIQKLRDGLAHANDYASNREKAKAVCSTTRDMLGLLEKLVVNPEAAR